MRQIIRPKVQRAQFLPAQTAKGDEEANVTVKERAWEEFPPTKSLHKNINQKNLANS